VKHLQPIRRQGSEGEASGLGNSEIADEVCAGCRIEIAAQIVARSRWTDGRRRRHRARRREVPAETPDVSQNFITKQASRR
jgi:hypothetical protein